MSNPSGERAPVRDPWKGLRGVMAATLVLEAVVVLLSLLAVAKVDRGTGAVGVGVVLALAAAMLLASGLQRRRWGLPLALALQLAMIGCGFVVPALGVLGVVFALVWGYLLHLRRDVARRMAAGELPGQQR